MQACRPARMCARPSGRRKGSMPQWLFNEGWPEKQRTGRLITKVHVELKFDDGKWQVLEDGKPPFAASAQPKLGFAKAHLYLQMTSHSNYPPREVFFDNVAFGSSEENEPATGPKAAMP
jgi:hypothetical protein